MNLYKRTLQTVEGFQDLTEEDKQRAIYLYKHKYIGYVLFLKETNFCYLFICLTGLIFAILGMSLDNSVFSNIAFAITLFLLPSFIVDIYLVISLIIIKINKYNRGISDVISKIAEKIANISLLNQKVITQSAWRKIRKYDKWQYQYLRSEECNHECYYTTKWLANFIQDPEIKVLWIGAEDIFCGCRCGHAILRKGDWVYDSNLRKTYKFDDYMKAFRAEIFKEFSLNGDKYFKENSYEIAYEEFGIWCKERAIKRASED